MAMRQPQRWEDVRDELQADWARTTLGQKRPWEDVQDDVRFGWEQGMALGYQGANFADVEDELQRQWEALFPHAKFEDWRSLKEAVQVGFERSRQG